PANQQGLNHEGGHDRAFGEADGAEHGDLAAAAVHGRIHGVGHGEDRADAHDGDEDGGEDDDFAGFGGEVFVIVGFGFGFEVDGRSVDVVDGRRGQGGVFELDDHAGAEVAVVG